MNRREFVLAASSLGVMATAGCTETDLSGGSGDESDDGDDGTGDTSSGGGSSSSSSGGGNVQYEESFVVEMFSESPETDQETTVVVRVNGQNAHWTFEGQQEIDFYAVDGDVYQVVSGQCFKGTEQADAPEVGPAPKPGEEWDPTADLPGEPDGRETIDGEEMLVFTYDPDTDTVYEGMAVTAYVSADTNYLRRIESEAWRIDYHSWGEVDPIEAPDMECQEFDGGGAGGGQ